MCNYEQALAALRVISGEIGGDLGARKIEQLRRNSNRFREGLFQMGCRVLGDVDSPVIPTMLYIPHAQTFGNYYEFDACAAANLRALRAHFHAEPSPEAKSRRALALTEKSFGI